MSEFRQDLVSGDWIIMAPERAKRPSSLKKGEHKRKPTPKGKCPFEDLKKSGNWPPVFQYPERGPWDTILIPNKYPALEHESVCATHMHRGPYSVMEGVGHHHLVLTRDHSKNFAHLSLREATRVLEFFQRYYRLIAKDECHSYVSAFSNWGQGAGATLYHPHYQLLALPIVPPDIGHSLRGSREYFKKHHTCVHCAMLTNEKEEKKRVIFESKRAIAIAPFVSRVPYEVRIFPTQHQAFFERTNKETLQEVAHLLQKVLLTIEKRLGDPDLNFFIHTSPLKNQKQFLHYHWHIEVLPKNVISLQGGAELSTGVDMNVIYPESAAKLLRGTLK